jgi:hypothetical protein
MLGGIGWRPNLVGAVAAILTRGSASVSEAIWERLREGSWVAPQLAVAAEAVDENFAQRAAFELEQLCARPTGWSSKSAAALDALVGGLDIPAVRALAEADDEGGANIALRWREDFRAVTNSSA